MAAVAAVVVGTTLAATEFLSPLPFTRHTPLVDPFTPPLEGEAHHGELVDTAPVLSPTTLPTITTRL